ncbi:MAG TPA: type II secretion system secretin GspD [Xanthobacteraceae bacterium]|nr:type II secretion system secretin GspD [Xanthobacteraceae bacterium]
MFFVAQGAVCAALLAACNPLWVNTDDTRDPDVFEKVRSIDLLPRFPKQVAQGAPPAGNRVRSTIYAGEALPAPEAAQARPTPSGDGYDLNFENTPVASVAKVVLGDILGVGYVIDPRVQGVISLSSGRPVPKADIVFVLENALRLGGVALVRDSAAYRLMPLADAVGAGAVDTADRIEPGYGVSVVPLQYVSAQTLMKLIDSFATKPGMVRADAPRNLILIQGTGTERRNAVDLALSFDADWMRGQSVGIFPVNNSNPEPIIAELEKILDTGENGVGQNVVKLQAITRMNAVMAVTRKPEVLRRVETWVRRLDAADTGRSGVHVYHLKYGDARQIARVLSDIFIGGGSAGGSLDGASGIAPGSGMSASSSSALSRLSASTTQSGSAPGGRALGGSSAGSAGANAPSSAQSGLAAGTATSQSGNLFDNRAGGAFGTSGATGGAGAVLPGVRITADTVNNALLIYSSQEQYSTIERTLRQIDRPQLQVSIDATVAEVTLNDKLNYGVQFYLQSRNLGLPPDRGSLLNTTAAEVTNTLINRAFPGFNFLVGRENQPNVILDALHAVTDVKVLSNPSVVVIDNQVATLQVGDEIPISTGSANVLTSSNTVVNTIDYRNTGIILRVVPRINANGNVRLEIEQEISNVVPNSGAGTLTPTVSQRKVRSSVAVASGQTVLLAGLISDRQTGGRSGIPVLDQIPVFGEAASHTDKSVQRTELIIFIRPQIIRDGVDAHFVAEELRTKLRGTLNATAPGPRYR